MNILDYVLAVILGYCLVRGIFRGLVKELSSIVGVLGGFYAAYNYYPQVAAPLARWISNPGYLNILSFSILFIVICLLVSIAGAIIKYLMNIVYFGWADRIGGAIFGTVKGFLIAAVLILMLTTFLSKNADILSKSQMARKMIPVSNLLVQVASKDMKALFSEKMKELNLTWQRQKR